MSDPAHEHIENSYALFDALIGFSLEPRAKARRLDPIDHGILDGAIKALKTTCDAQALQSKLIRIIVDELHSIPSNSNGELL